MRMRSEAIYKKLFHQLICRVFLLIKPAHLLYRFGFFYSYIYKLTWCVGGARVRKWTISYPKILYIYSKPAHWIIISFILPNDLCFISSFIARRISEICWPFHIHFYRLGSSLASNCCTNQPQLILYNVIHSTPTEKMPTSCPLVDQVLYPHGRCENGERKKNIGSYAV